MRKADRPNLYSFISGCIWAAIGFGVAWSVSPIRSTPSDVARIFSGGLVAAPLIGILVGTLSRKFCRLGRSARIAFALANLCLAVWLFLTAASVVRLLSGEVAWAGAFEALVSDPILGTLLGLTYTGYILVLWPLSYANHALIAKAFDDARVA
jgi:hypothetical protein